MAAHSQPRLARRAVAVAAVAGGAVVAPLAALAAVDTDDGDVSDAPRADSARTFVAVERCDLTRVETIDGTVARADIGSLRLRGSGTITALPTVGQVVSSGQVLAEVDGEPVVLLAGARPAWRPLGPGVDDGEDVRQLEEALVALGYADPAVFVPDDEWTSETTRAVKHLQFTLGLPEDGRLDLGEVVFSPATTARVAEVEAALGGPADGGVVVLTAEEQVVGADLDAVDTDLVAAGDEVDVELASGEVLAGSVSAIGPAEVAADGSVTLPVQVAVDGLAAADGLPAEVQVTVVEASGVLCAPVEALLALAEGGYAVEVRDDAEPAGTRLVGVDTGVFAEGRVEVAGELAEGDEVVVP